MALAIDASSPAVAVNSVNTTLTLPTVSFTPPANSLLLILWSGDEQSGGGSSAPTITDNLGVHLTYTRAQWKANGQGAPAVNGQVAIWTAPVSTSAAMTVSVNNNTIGNFREAALRVVVLTDTGQPTVGASSFGGQSTGTAVPMAFTASQTGSWGFSVTVDWDAVATETAGTGTTAVSASGSTGGTRYGLWRRTTADGVISVATTLNATLSVASANLAWAAVEIKASAAGAVANGGFAGRRFWPGRSPHRRIAPNRVTYFSTDAPVATTVLITDTDTATFTDAAIDQGRTDSDTATFTDTASAQGRTDADTATFTEGTSVGVPVSDGDTASFTDTVTAQSRTATDSGTFIDTVTAQSRTATDTGTFTDTVSAQARTDADTATFTEGASVNQSSVPISDADTASFTDTVTAQARTATDTGTFTDTVTAQGRTATDTGTFTEGQSLNTGATPITDADTITITDAPSTLSAALSAAESAGWADAPGTLSAALSGADTASLTDLRGSTLLSVVEALALADATGARQAILIAADLLSILDAGSAAQTGLSPLVYYGSTGTVIAGRGSVTTVTDAHLSTGTVTSSRGSTSTEGGKYGSDDSVTSAYDSDLDVL